MLHEAAGRGVPNDAVSTPGATDHPVASSSDDPSETGERFASSSGWRVEGAVRLGVLVMYRGVELDVSFVRTFVGERNHKQARWEIITRYGKSSRCLRPFHQDTKVCLQTFQNKNKNTTQYHPNGQPIHRTKPNNPYTEPSQ